MKLTKFYGKSAQLFDKESAVELIQQLDKKYGININLGFKTASFKYFKFLKNDDFEFLRNYPHLITVNYGINPIWCLYLTTDPKTNLKMSLYINLVTQQVIWSKHRFSDNLYKGTLFEGEIIGNTFVIWDLLINKNRSCINFQNHRNYLNLNQRIDVIRSILDQHYQSDPLIENLNIRMKPYVTYPYLKSFINELSKNDPHYKGIYFVPIDRSVKCFSVIFSESHQISDYPRFLDQLEENDLNPHLVQKGKIADPNSNEFIQEFWLAPLPNFRDNYRIYHWTNRNEIYDLGPVAVVTLDTSLMLQKTFKENLGINKFGIKNLLKFKCKYLKKFRRWEPIELVD